MDVVIIEVKQELLTVNLIGKNVGQVTWVVFTFLFCGIVDEGERTLATCELLFDD